MRVGDANEGATSGRIGQGLPTPNSLGGTDKGVEGQSGNFHSTRFMITFDKICTVITQVYAYSLFFCCWSGPRNPLRAREHFLRAVRGRHRFRRPAAPADGAELVERRPHPPRRPEHRGRPQLSERFRRQKLLRPPFHLSAARRLRRPAARRDLDVDVFAGSVNFGWKISPFRRCRPQEYEPNHILLLFIFFVLVATKRHPYVRPAAAIIYL